MKVKEIAEKKDKELQKELSDLNIKHTKVRFEVSTRETNKHTELKEIRRQKARIKTILREREIQREESKDEKKV
jgi:large subunit ribosomal protein L29